MNGLVKVFMSCLMLLFVACSSNNIIPQKDMVRILTKIYLTDGTISIPDRVLLSAKDTIAYYEPILEHYGYTTEQFDSSIKYYSQNTQVFDEILDRVIMELSKMEEKSKEKLMAIDSLDGERVDSSLNIWPVKTYWDMALDHASNSSLGFDIPVKGLGTYKISFNAQVFPDDESEDTRLYFFFYYDDKTPEGNRSGDIYHSYVKDGNIYPLSFTMTLDNPNVTHISGWLYDHGGEKPDIRRHAIFSKLMVTYVLSEQDSSRKHKRRAELERVPVDR